MDSVNEYVLTNAALFDGINFSLLENSLVHIKDGKIISITTTDQESTFPSTATVIDLKGKFIIPGLIDSHMHFFQGSGLYTWPNVLDLRHIKPYDQAMAEIYNSLPELFKRYLACGVTGIVSCGGPMYDFTIRELGNKEEILAPDIEVAGPFASPVSADKLTLHADPPIISVATPDIIRDLVQRCAEKKAVFVKILYHKVGLFASDTEKLAFIVQESKNYGLRVAVHVTELEAAKTVVKLGVDILVHSVWDNNVDDEFIALLKKNNVIYIPTLLVRQSVRDVFRARLELSEFEQKFGDPKVLQSFRDILTIPLDQIPEPHRSLVHLGDLDLPDYNTFSFPNLRRIASAGVIIAAGTDAGNVGTLHGPSLHSELEMMVKAGMRPVDVLISATTHGAHVMNRTDIGTIEVGKKANLVILDDNPLVDITNTRKIYKIMKDGNLFSPTDLCQPTLPADIIDRQINAYNEHKIIDFVAFYHPKVQVYNLLTGKLFLYGLTELSAYYYTIFSTSPQVKIHTLNRIVNGSLIIDFQHITGQKDTNDYNSISIYQVKNHFITQVWFGR